jgi:hypothetical protein
MTASVISLRGEVWAHKTSLTPPLFIEVSVLRQVMYLCVRIIDCVSFCDFSIGFWNCSNSVVYFVFHFIR